MNPSPLHPEQLLPLLVHIQTSLEEDLSLAQIADLAGMSPFHFHRLFRQAVGETLKQYTQRLRLERAAHELRLCRATVLEVALGAGFQSHETFTRAFKRHFGLRPKDFRQSGRLPTLAASASPPIPLNQYTSHYQLSKVRLQQLQPIPLAFIRSLGPYVDVDATLFDQLLAWAKARQLVTGDNLFIGIGHDAPYHPSGQAALRRLPHRTGAICGRGSDRLPILARRSLCHRQLHWPLRPNPGTGLPGNFPASGPIRTI